MGFVITGGAGNDVNADANNNLKVTLPSAVSQAGYAVIVGEVSATDRRSPDVSGDRRLVVGVDTPVFDYTFNATAHNTTLFRHVFATMTATMAGGSLLLNAASTLTATTGVQHTTWRSFPLFGLGGLRVSQAVSMTQAPLANQIVEFGLMPHGTGTAAPTDGVFFRYTSAGLFGVVNFNGTETVSSVLSTTGTVGTDTSHRYVIKISERACEFYDENSLLGSVAVAAANGEPFMTAALPWSCQFRNGGTVTGSPVMQCKIYSCDVAYRDANVRISRAAQMAGMGLAISQGQSGGTLGSTALLTNSLAAGAGAAMTNTTAALGTGLGGQFTAQPTLAAGTDGIVCSYQNPAGGINQTPRSLVITGIRVQSSVTASLTGGPVLWFYSLAYGHTAVSLATTETGSFVTATAKAPRRVALGQEAIVVTAAAGTLGAGVAVTFASPIVVHPGEFVALVAKNLGTVTSAGTVTFAVTFDGYME